MAENQNPPPAPPPAPPLTWRDAALLYPTIADAVAAAVRWPSDPAPVKP